jgi:predicted ATP-grasp superfamily ATP-dependent carboligase
LLVGASVRAAAFSALRAGITPSCIDLFADTDLRAAAEVQRCPFDDYPHQLPELLRCAPPGPVIYAGGLENYPAVVDAMALDRPLWGNDGAVLRKARDPFFVARLLKENDLRCPMVARSARKGKSISVSGASGYLRKPFKSAGGAQVSFATTMAPGFFFQQFIPGSPFSAVYCTVASGTELLGITQQLVGEPWLNAKQFSYCGSIGPVTLEPAIEKNLARLGEVLAHGCGLRGLFGVDFILHEGEPWLVEVNPRYTASIEVLELATGLRSFECQRAAFDPNWRTGLQERSSECSVLGALTQPVVGKAILFASRRLTFHGLDRIKNAADVPAAGEVIEEGWPILTVFSAGQTQALCRKGLQDRADDVYQLLGGH